MGPHVFFFSTAQRLPRAHACPRTGVSSAKAPFTLYLGGPGPGSRNFKISPMHPPNFKIIAVPSSFNFQLSEYYNFGRIEPGRHGCPFGLENGHLRPQIIISPRCAALVRAVPYQMRGKSSLTWGAARQKRPFS